MFYACVHVHCYNNQVACYLLLIVYFTLSNITVSQNLKYSVQNTRSFVVFTPLLNIFLDLKRQNCAKLSTHNFQKYSKISTQNNNGEQSSLFHCQHHKYGTHYSYKVKLQACINSTNNGMSNSIHIFTIEFILHSNSICTQCMFLRKLAKT